MRCLPEPAIEDSEPRECQGDVAKQTHALALANLTANVCLDQHEDSIVCTYLRDEYADVPVERFAICVLDLDSLEQVLAKELLFRLTDRLLFK